MRNYIVAILFLLLCTVPLQAQNAPRVVVLQTSTGVSVSLLWDANDPAENIDGYNVYRATTTGAPGTKVNGSLIGAPGYVDTTPPRGATYFYTVTAFRMSDNQESNRSAEVTVVIPRLKPSAPKNLRVTQLVAYVFDALRALATFFVKIF